MKKVNDCWYPSDGYRYITDGKTYASAAYFPSDEVAARWHDTNDEPPEDESDISDEEALGIIIRTEHL